MRPPAATSVKRVWWRATRLFASAIKYARESMSLSVARMELLTRINVLWKWPNVKVEKLWKYYILENAQVMAMIMFFNWFCLVRGPGWSHCAVFLNKTQLLQCLSLSRCVLASCEGIQTNLRWGGFTSNGHHYSHTYNAIKLQHSKLLLNFYTYVIYK